MNILILGGGGVIVFLAGLGVFFYSGNIARPF